MIKKMFNRFVRWIGYDLNISPNQITWGRLFVFIPGWFLWVYKHELAAASGFSWQLYGAIAIFIVTTVILFDVVDGALARETGQVSDQGKMLDPLVDKFITYSTLILFWPAIEKVGLGILFVLDMLSTLLRGSHVEGANQFGKKKALAQNISKFFFATAVLTGTAWINNVGNTLIWLAVLLASISVGIRALPVKVKDSIRVLVPQVLTLSNLAAGIGTIWCAFNGKIEIGVMLNFAAMAFDLFDGAVARKLGVTSSFGKYFDTVADLISFGAGPAFLVAAINDFSFLPVCLGVSYFLATCLRLYDYGRSKDKTPAGFFRGFPSPAGAWLVVSSVLLGFPEVSVVVMLVSAALMCTFKIYWIHFNRALPDLKLLELLAAVLIGGIIAVSIVPSGMVAGPIVVYIFAPFWRKPAAVS